MDLGGPNPDALRAVRDFLVRCFDDGQFRRLVSDVAPTITSELPGEGCSLAKLIADGVDLLWRCAQLNLRFFERWAELQPQRRSEIIKLAGAMGFSVPQTAANDATLTTAASKTPPSLGVTAPRPELLLFLVFVVLVVVVLVVFFGLRASPYRVEYTVAVFLIAMSLLLVLCRESLAAAIYLLAGLGVLFWIGRRKERQEALAA